MKKHSEKKKAWVWFKGGLKGGKWEGGFMASKNDDETFSIERSDYVTCKVAKWRLMFKEPEDEKKGPEIPEQATWKYP